MLQTGYPIKKAILELFPTYQDHLKQHEQMFQQEKDKIILSYITYSELYIVIKENLSIVTKIIKYKKLGDSCGWLAPEESEQRYDHGSCTIQAALNIINQFDSFIRLRDNISI